MSLVDDVIEAHGGLELWRRTAEITLNLSSGGLAFTAKGQRATLRSLRATVTTTGQTVHLQAPGWAHRFDSGIPGPEGLRWTTSDIAAFAASAVWTYTALPFVLPELDVEEQPDRLVVHFPPAIRTHSPRQVLHIGPDRLIRRHDYTALDFGRWARATQEVGGYKELGGFMIATRRRVRPRFWPHRPLLVWIDVESVEVLSSSTAP